MFFNGLTLMSEERFMNSESMNGQVNGYRVADERTGSDL